MLNRLKRRTVLQQRASQFPHRTHTYYLRSQLGSLLLKQVLHLLDVELLSLCFIQLPFKG